MVGQENFDRFLRSYVDKYRERLVSSEVKSLLIMPILNQASHYLVQPGRSKYFLRLITFNPCMVFANFNFSVQLPLSPSL